MYTPKFTDIELEKLWGDLGDIPIDEAECIELPFLHFPVGTYREDIWHWFDEEHSEGVNKLMYNKKGRL
jgi:hypothetical protein